MPEKNSLLGNYVVQLDSRLSGLEDNVQKLSTIVNKIVNDQAVFDFKQEQNVRVSSKLEEIVEKAREKLEGISSEFTRECDKRESKLNETLSSFKVQVDKTCAENKTSVERQIKDLERDIKALQRWVNLAIGGGAVLIFIIEILQNGGFRVLGL